MSLVNRRDPSSFKTRRAKVGGYRDYFTPEQLAELDELVAKGLSPTLGYGSAPEAPASRA